MVASLILDHLHQSIVNTPIREITIPRLASLCTANASRRNRMLLLEMESGLYIFIVNRIVVSNNIADDTQFDRWAPSFNAVVINNAYPMPGHSIGY
jgi:hypothetical protein